VKQSYVLVLVILLGIILTGCSKTEPNLSDVTIKTLDFKFKPYENDQTEIPDLHFLNTAYLRVDQGEGGELLTLINEKGEILYQRKHLDFIFVGYGENKQSITFFATLLGKTYWFELGENGFLLDRQGPYEQAHVTHYEAESVVTLSNGFQTKILIMNHEGGKLWEKDVPYLVTFMSKYKLNYYFKYVDAHSQKLVIVDLFNVSTNVLNQPVGDDLVFQGNSILTVIENRQIIRMNRDHTAFKSQVYNEINQLVITDDAFYFYDVQFNQTIVTILDYYFNLKHEFETNLMINQLDVNQKGDLIITTPNQIVRMDQKGKIIKQIPLAKKTILNANPYAILIRNNQNQLNVYDQYLDERYKLKHITEETTIEPIHKDYYLFYHQTKHTVTLYHRNLEKKWSKKDIKLDCFITLSNNHLYLQTTDHRFMIVNKKGDSLIKGKIIGTRYHEDAQIIYYRTNDELKEMTIYY
jgi:hypothetical protein